MPTINIAPLHWCHDMRPHSGPALYTDGSVFSHPYRGYTVTVRTPSRMQHQTPYIILNKIEDFYQTYINTHKTHTMATHHRGMSQPPEKNPNPQEHDVNVQNEYQEDVDDFENVEHEYHTQLRDLTNEIDYL